MTRISQPFATLAVLLVASVGYGQDFVDLLGPGGFSDLGDITSDGSGGRPSHVRPLAGGVSDGYEVFDYSGPPAAPKQSDILLMEGEPIVLTLPQLAHLPQRAEFSVAHLIDGFTITVEASIHFEGWSTGWLVPPHEYVHTLGELPAGDYRLTLNTEQSYWSNPDEPWTSTGYIDFQVLAVPEPYSFSLVVAAFLGLGLRRRW